MADLGGLGDSIIDQLEVLVANKSFPQLSVGLRNRRPFELIKYSE
jgi:hypothetical protein